LVTGYTNKDGTNTFKSRAQILLVVPGMMIFLFIMIAYIYPLFFADFVSSHIETFKMDYGVEIFSNETT